MCVKGYLTDDALEGSTLQIKGDEKCVQLVPQHIHPTKDFTLSMRVKRPLGTCTVYVQQGNKVIKTLKVAKALPAEMIQIPIQATMLQGLEDVEVRIG